MLSVQSLGGCIECCGGKFRGSGIACVCLSARFCMWKVCGKWEANELKSYHITQ